MCLVQINFLGLHQMYVKHGTRDLNNIGVYEILVEGSRCEVYVARCLHTIQCI